MNDERPAARDDPDQLIARAIESVLDAVPRLPGGDVAAPETSPKAQPWAETAAPAGRNKRPLEALLEEYSARVASAPNARAGRPDEPYPAEAYLERLSAPATRGARRGKRRWRGGRRRRGTGRRGPG